MTEIEDLKTHLVTAIEACAGLDALEAVRVEALGKQGRVTQLLKTLGAMSPEERLVQGPAIQGLREAVASAIASRKNHLEGLALEARLASERVDVTLPAEAPPTGTIHPVSQVMDELAEIFADLGFAVASGPEIEDDWHNFGALNIPDTHPARAMQDTFYLLAPSARSRGEGAERSEGGSEAGASHSALPLSPALSPEEERELAPPMVLRTHTSPVQIRTMVEVARRRGSVDDGIRIIAPGRVYRSDWDATHTPMFHQIEGLVLGRGITLGHLKWTLETFLRAFFERHDVVLRLRPSYFPFTEPSAEVDVGYTLVKAKRVIGGADGWMEVLGSGMVHPRVIAACGLDPAVWQGFAFGCGIDRLAMLKYGIDDLRPMFEADLRWLKHYGFSALDVPTLSGGVGA